MCGKDVRHFVAKEEENQSKESENPRSARNGCFVSPLQGGDGVARCRHLQMKLWPPLQCAQQPVGALIRRGTQTAAGEQLNILDWSKRQ